MYDNSTPIDGQVSSARGNLVPVTKSNPCPHCGKPDWCYSIGELSVCNRDQPPATGWEATSKTDKDGKIYYAPIREKKAIRPRQTRYWEYPARDGSPLVRVVRFDDGEGGKPKWTQQSWGKCKRTKQMGWIGGLEGIVREDIPIYRYAEVRKAIANNELIFIAEGEDNVDKFWALGFAATCNIGGSGKWRDSDTRDLEGAKVVIVPDRDEPGINHAEGVHQHFPSALWLYPFPNSKAWENLPKSKGLDIADWIEQHQITTDDIRAAIGEKKIFNAPAPTAQAAANVVRPPQFQVPPISELGGEVEELLDSDLRQSELRLKFLELAQKFRVTSAEVSKLYNERQQELEEKSNLEDLKIGIEQLLASQSASVKLSDLFPESLAAPIETVATRMNLKPECYALALITGVSRFLKNGSSTMLVEEWNRYRCRTHGYFGVMIAEVSQMKTPVLNAMIADPLAAMRENNQKKFEAQKEAYEVEFEQWKNSKDEDKGPAPDAPVEKFAYITKATWEGIAGMVGRAPTQGILWLCDELAGFFNSANQYRSGKGSDKEDLLEAWSGNGAVIARAAGTTVNVGAVSLSIYGNIQPKVLAPFLGDGSDNNGTFARFDFVQQPPALTQITLGLPKIDINPMLQALYERVDAISITEFALDEEARKLFVDYYNHCQRLRLNHPKQGMRAMLGKAAEKVGRVATILHCIHAAHLGGEVSSKIPASRVKAAIKWVEYTTQQALSINIEVCNPEALDATHTKILNEAREKGGNITADQTRKLLGDGRHRPEISKVVGWFEKLAAMNYGEVTKKGRSIIFSLSPVSRLSPLVQNQDTASVTEGDNLIPFASPVSPLSRLTEPDNEFSDTKRDTNGIQTGYPIPFVKPLSDISSSLKGDKRDTFAFASDNAESQMLSRTTESAELSDEHLAKITADKMREAIASSNFEGAKEIMKQINVSTSQLRGLFWQNLERTNEKNKARLLAFANLSEGTPVKYVGKIEQYAQEKLTAYDADGHGGITCLLADGRGFTTWIPTRDLRKKL
jgi:hypothetical protein